MRLNQNGKTPTNTFDIACLLFKKRSALKIETQFGGNNDDFIYNPSKEFFYEEIINKS